MGNPIEARWLSIPTEIELASSVSGKPRARIQLLRVGDWHHPKAPGQRLSITNAKLEEFESNFRKGVKGRELPTNEDHLDSRCSRSPAWIVDMDRKDGALYGTLEFSNDKIFQAVKNGEIKYISPEIQFGWRNPEDGKSYDVIKAAAFTNVPYIKNMEPAQILNLSEAALDDRDLVDLSCAKEFDRAIGAIRSELKDQGRSDWTWSFDELSKAFRQIGGDKDAVIERTNALTATMKDTLESVTFNDPIARSIVMKHQGDIYDAIQKVMIEHGVALSEVHLGPWEPGGNPNDRQLDAEQEEPQGDPNQQPQVGQEGLADAQDPDAQSADLPMQCASCSKLADGSCPFQGIAVKVAAAQDGNCPQYLSTSADVDDMGQGDPLQGDSSQQTQDVPPAKMSEVATGEQMTLEELQAQLTALTERMDSEKATLLAETTQARQKIAQLEKDKVLAARQSFVDKYVDQGRITPAQATACLSLFAIYDGDTDVKLSDNETPATLETLLSEIIDSIEPNLSLAESGPDANVRRVSGRPDEGTHLSEHERRYDQYVVRAKELAAANNRSDFAAFLSEAARNVNREMASPGGAN